MQTEDKRSRFSDDEIEEIASRISIKVAEKAAEIAIERMTKDVYAAVGKTVVHKATMIVGVIATAFVFFAASKGWIKLP